jgi:ribosomal protein L37E
MAKEDTARACRNCGRMQPESLLNKEGRCQTCGPSDTPVRAADPSETPTPAEE